MKQPLLPSAPLTPEDTFIALIIMLQNGWMLPRELTPYAVSDHRDALVMRALGNSQALFPDRARAAAHSVLRASAWRGQDQGAVFELRR